VLRDSDALLPPPTFPPPKPPHPPQEVPSAPSSTTTASAPHREIIKDGALAVRNAHQDVGQRKRSLPPNPLPARERPSCPLLCPTLPTGKSLKTEPSPCAIPTKMSASVGALSPATAAYARCRSSPRIGSCSNFSLCEK
jgi:hypothetical protein